MSINLKTQSGLKKINSVRVTSLTPPEPPADGKTRLYISLVEGRLSPVLGLGINGSVDVDWGDDTEHGTMTGSDTSTLVTIPHTYAQGGDYVITLTAAEGTTIQILGSNYGTSLLAKVGTTATEAQAYRTSLKKAFLGNSVTRLGDSAFNNCCSLTSVTIPDSVTWIGDYAFYNCYSLTSVILPDSVRRIGISTFNNCCSLTSVTIPDSVVFIENHAFNYCYSLTNVILPDSVVNMYNNVFSYCYSLTSVILPDNLTSIASSMFYDCHSLTNITIPGSVASIESSVFIDCRSLGFIKFERNTPPVVSQSGAFSDIPTDCVIYIPQGTREAYTTAANYPKPNKYTYVEY